MKTRRKVYYRDVYPLRGGMDAWRQAGFPLEQKLDSLWFRLQAVCFIYADPLKAELQTSFS